MSKISICLWYANEAEQAAALYVSLFPDSRIDKVHRSPADTPGNKEGDVLTVEFTLADKSFLGLNGGEHAEYSHAMSLSVDCADQAEVDRLWLGLIADGGAEIRCGWLKDRWGVRWQIIPRVLPRLLADPDRARAKRAMQAMLTMVKIDIADLERAAAAP